MKLTDPHKFLAAIDQEYWNEVRGIDRKSVKPCPDPEFRYVEPNCGGGNSVDKPDADAQKFIALSTRPTVTGPKVETLRGKIQQLGDFIDTDAVSSIACTFRFSKISETDIPFTARSCGILDANER